MAAFREGKVVSVVTDKRPLIKARVAIGDGEIDAVAYPTMTGSLAAGDRVIVNTTGLELELGTGGEGFVLWNLDGPEVDPGRGHIIKLRYTPWQTEVLSAEAPESEQHQLLKDVDSIEGMPVVACGLHSQIAGVVAGIKAADPDATVGYLMSDAGALALAWSRLVSELEEASLIDVSCTYGHAFGGDIEAVNLFSGLAALRTVGRADIVVAAMGPGGVGTGTRLGYSGIELAQVVDAAGGLGGRPIACVRVSFSDARDRHQGVSHHSLTSLNLAARPCRIALPKLPVVQRDELVRQLTESGACKVHEVVFADGRPGLELLEARGVSPTTMGRAMDESPEAFLAAAAAGAIAAQRADR